MYIKRKPLVKKSEFERLEHVCNIYLSNLINFEFIVLHGRTTDFIIIILAAIKCLKFSMSLYKATLLAIYKQINKATLLILIIIECCSKQLCITL